MICLLRTVAVTVRELVVVAEGAFGESIETGKAMTAFGPSGHSERSVHSRYVSKQTVRHVISCRTVPRLSTCGSGQEHDHETEAQHKEHNIIFTKSSINYNYHPSIKRKSSHSLRTNHPTTTNVTYPNITSPRNTAHTVLRNSCLA